MRRRSPLRAKARLVDAGRLRGGAPTARGVGLRRVNRVRKARLDERNFGAKADWVRSHPCLRCGMPPTEPGVIQAAHVIPRGMGGCKGDRTTLVPLCDVRGCHREQESMSPERYLVETGVDILAEAARLEAEWQARN